MSREILINQGDEPLLLNVDGLRTNELRGYIDWTFINNNLNMELAEINVGSSNTVIEAGDYNVLGINKITFKRNTSTSLVSKTSINYKEHNVAILEGGKQFQFSGVKKLGVRTRSEYEAVLAAKSNVILTEKYIYQEGTYNAVDDNALGYSKVYICANGIGKTVVPPDDLYEPDEDSPFKSNSIVTMTGNKCKRIEKYIQSYGGIQSKEKTFEFVDGAVIAEFHCNGANRLLCAYPTPGGKRSYEGTKYIYKDGREEDVGITEHMYTAEASNYVSGGYYTYNGKTVYFMVLLVAAHYSPIYGWAHDDNTVYQFEGVPDGWINEINLAGSKILFAPYFKDVQGRVWVGKLAWTVLYGNIEGWSGIPDID